MGKKNRLKNEQKGSSGLKLKGVLLSEKTCSMLQMLWSLLHKPPSSSTVMEDFQELALHFLFGENFEIRIIREGGFFSVCFWGRWII